jgi:hypothetical protein
MTDTAWKAWERRVATIFGGKRRGAYTGSAQGRKSDIIKPGWSIEVKLLSRPNFSDLLAAALQAETNADQPTDIPVAVIKRKGDLDTQALVVMRLETFRQFFIDEVSDGLQPPTR